MPNNYITVILEPGESSWAARAPQIPGVYAVEETPDKTLELFREAVEFHFEGLEEKVPEGIYLATIDLSPDSLPALRRKASLTQAEAAKLLGWSRPRISELEHNPGAVSTARMGSYIRLLAERLNLPPFVSLESISYQDAS